MGLLALVGATEASERLRLSAVGRFPPTDENPTNRAASELSTLARCGDIGLRSRSVKMCNQLQEQGFATGAIIIAFVLDARFGLDQGFETYNDQFEEEPVTVRARGNVAPGPRAALSAAPSPGPLC